MKVNKKNVFELNNLRLLAYIPITWIWLLRHMILKCVRVMTVCTNYTQE